MSSGDLEKSLRDDIEAYVQGRIGGLQDEVARLQSQLNEAFTRLSERIGSDAQTDASLAVAVSEHIRNARNAGIEAAAEKSTRARSSSEIAIIKAAIDELDGQRTQSDILNALVNRAASFAPRVAFFVVKQERTTGWRARGLEGTVGDDAVREISLPLSSDTLLGEVVRTRSTWSGGPGQHAEDHTIFSHFGEEPPQRAVAVPLVARDKAVAVLYADSALQDADAVNLEAIETLVRVAGMAVELLATQRPSHASAPQPQTQTDAAAVPPPATDAEPTRVTDEETAPHSAFVTPQPETQEAVEPEAAPAEAESVHADAESAPAHVEHTPAAEEFPSASDTWGSGGAGTTPMSGAAFAPPSTATEGSPLGASRRQSAADMDFPVEVREEEKRYHNEARRFARLLVSEIKLYNEQKVQEGRDAGDLYNRLRDDIDRSRQMYDKRVRSEVAERYDYFHHELVNALAGGDPAKLGDGYPGATVSV
ncbi:MAG: GAF domain-containing protein [Acidobacteria bacterium]|nr:GAF domain-containing protein [Acidobacteriota bacterium]